MLGYLSKSAPNRKLDFLWLGVGLDLVSLFPICYECVCSYILWAIRKCTWWIFSICSESSQVPWGSLGLPNDNCYSILSYLFRKLKSVWSVNSRYYLWSFRKHTWQINKWRNWFGEESLDASQAPGQSSSCNTCRSFGPIFYFVHNPSILVCQPWSFISPFNDNASKVHF